MHGYPTHTEVDTVPGRTEMHPDYHSLTEAGQRAEIALVRLSKPFESLTAQPVRLDTEAEALLYPQPATMTTTVGWGGPNSSTMRKAEWPLQACPAGDVRSLCTCATGERHAEDGDIGDPLLVETPGGEWAQLGVLYYRDYEPSLGRQRYVPVAPYLEWIAETVGKPDHLAVTLKNNVPGTCTVNLGDLFTVLLIAAETRTFGTTVRASNGDVYRLVLDGTTWTAVRVDP